MLEGFYLWKIKGFAGVLMQLNTSLLSKQICCRPFRTSKSRPFSTGRLPFEIFISFLNYVFLQHTRYCIYCSWKGSSWLMIGSKDRYDLIVTNLSSLFICILFTSRKKSNTFYTFILNDLIWPCFCIVRKILSRKRSKCSRAIIYNNFVNGWLWSLHHILDRMFWRF